MTDREKLIVQIESTPCCGFSSRTAVEHIADHLISNGVTVQEWISVKDRLPDAEDVFLCWSKPLSDMMFCFTSDFQLMEVTHWMPLPEGPEEQKEYGNET